MDNLKRFTVCKLLNHAYVRVPYPPGPDGEEGGTFLRCTRCGKENHNAGTVPRGGGGVM
jgi:hypothetical protein